MTRAAPDFAEPCLRRMKRVSGGAWVAARIHRTCHCTINSYPEDCSPHPWRITCDRYPQLEAEIDGRPADVDRVWTSGEDIDEAEYRYLLADLDHARLYRPDSPEANPFKPTDFNTLPPPEF